jgi:predicted aconitase with swiveling domain
MQPSEIISQDAQRSGVNPDVLLSHIAELTNAKKAILIQKNDSVLQVTMVAPEVAELHLYTVDSPLTLAQSLKQFYKELQGNPHVRVYYGKADSPEIIKLMKAAGLPVEDSDNNKYNWMIRD